MDFCSYSFEELLRLPTESRPFGKKPFPCLNPAAEHFKKAVINDVYIKSKQKSETEIAGTFSCQCGFTYIKYWQKDQKVSRFKFDRIVEYGKVWDNALIKMFKDSNGNPDIEEVGKKLGVVARTLTRQIARLCLTDKYDSLMPKKLGNARMSFEDIERKRQLYRNIWLEKRQENPQFSRTDLRKTIEPVFSWLYKHDPQWLSENLPEKKKYQFTHQYVDWNQRDEEATRQIVPLATQLKALPEKPVFVSKTALIRKLKLSNIVKHPDKIPLTLQALETYSENYEEYAFRRIEWGVKECIKLGKVMGRHSFAEMLGIAPRFLLRRPSVNKKLDEAMQKIASAII